MAQRTLKETSERFVGLDSIVYRAGDQAYHVYDALGIAHVAPYADAVNTASRFLATHPFVLPIPLPEHRGQFTLRLARVEPIQSVREIDGNPVTISNFIPGPTVAWMWMNAYQTLFKKGIMQFSDETERNRAVVARSLWQELPGLHRAAAAAFVAFGAKIEKQFGYTGIEIIPLNVKARFPEDNFVDLVITDICDNIKLFARTDRDRDVTE